MSDKAKFVLVSNIPGPTEYYKGSVEITDEEQQYNKIVLTDDLADALCFPDWSSANSFLREEIWCGTENFQIISIITI